MQRRVHRPLDLGFSLLGIASIFASIGFSDTMSVQVQVLCALTGILMLEAGVWGLSNKLLPSERRFTRLRAEGDNTIRLIRELNSAAVARDKGLEDESRFQATLEEMHATVQRMAELASLEDDDASESKPRVAAAA